MKLLSFIIFLCSALTTLNAQHCPFDNAAILVAEITDAEAGTPLKNITLSLVDESGKQLIWTVSENYPLVFSVNSDSIYQDWYPYHFKRIRYSFAGDNYVLPLSWEVAKWNARLMITDSTGKYESKIISLKQDDFFDLHENIGDWTELYTKYHHETPPPKDKFHHTIEIKLKRKS